MLKSRRLLADVRWDIIHRWWNAVPKMNFAKDLNISLQKSTRPHKCSGVKSCGRFTSQYWPRYWPAQNDRRQDSAHIFLPQPIWENYDRSETVKNAAGWLQCEFSHPPISQCSKEIQTEGLRQINACIIQFKVIMGWSLWCKSPTRPASWTFCVDL